VPALSVPAGLLQSGADSREVLRGRKGFGGDGRKAWQPSSVDSVQAVLLVADRHHLLNPIYRPFKMIIKTSFMDVKTAVGTTMRLFVYEPNLPEYPRASVASREPELLSRMRLPKAPDPADLPLRCWLTLSQTPSGRESSASPRSIR
jgi:hypothetical protein